MIWRLRAAHAYFSRFPRSTDSAGIWIAQVLPAEYIRKPFPISIVTNPFWVGEGEEPEYWLSLNLTAKSDVRNRSISSVCHKGNHVAIRIRYLKISSTPGLLGECLCELHASRLKFLK